MIEQSLTVSLPPTLVLHHEGNTCKARLGRWGICPACNVIPDMHSTALLPYCPVCDVPLMVAKCPACKRIFVKP